MVGSAEAGDALGFQTGPGTRRCVLGAGSVVPNGDAPLSCFTPRQYPYLVTLILLYVRLSVLRGSQN